MLSIASFFEFVNTFFAFFLKNMQKIFVFLNSAE